MSDEDRSAWQLEHERRVAALPAGIREAHTHCSDHRAEILASSICGCFYCCTTFAPSLIEEWIDAGATALCPRCGIDSVLGDQSGAEITLEFLTAMKQYWF
jgi:hypothetical protein